MYSLTRIFKNDRIFRLKKSIYILIPKRNKRYFSPEFLKGYEMFFRSECSSRTRFVGGSVCLSVCMYEICMYVCLYLTLSLETKRQRDRDTEIQRYREKQRETEKDRKRQRDIKTKRQRDKMTKRQTNKETERQREWLSN